jgi:atypical dual specificity phosphatase
MFAHVVKRFRLCIGKMENSHNEKLWLVGAGATTVGLLAMVVYWKAKKTREHPAHMVMNYVPLPVRYRLTQVALWPTVGYKLMMTRLGCHVWWDKIDDNIILGALPLSWHVPLLKAEGVTHVINMCAEYAGPGREYRQAGIEQLMLETVDFTEPSLRATMTAVDFINTNAKKGSITYVHCKAGRGRSAQVVLCYLIKYKGLTPEEANKVLQERRPNVSRTLLSREVVKQFVESVRKAKSPTD